MLDFWEGRSAEERKDDAYGCADMRPLSTRISGTVRKIEVDDFEAVKAGVLAVQSDVDRTESERKCQQALLAAKATTHQQLEQAVTDANRFSGILASRQADLARAQTALARSRTMLEAANTPQREASQS